MNANHIPHGAIEKTDYIKSPMKTILPVTTLKEILGNAIVYADYIAGNHNCPIVREGAKNFSADCEKELASIHNPVYIHP